MKRIKIDSSLVQSVKDFNTKLFNAKRSTFEFPKKKLKKLYKTLVCNNQKRYVIKLFREYNQIINLKPNEFSKKKQEFDLVYFIDGINRSVSTEFGKKIVEALRYDAYRESEYPEIINQLRWNLKVCFYCNYTGTLTVEKDTNEYKTYYDLDHVLPKSNYPFLAISFFNFIPCCASCNRNKSKKIITNLNPFFQYGESSTDLNKVFGISTKSKIQFYINNDKNFIEIEVNDIINNVAKTDLNKVVDLKLLYNTQKNEAEEILWKKKIYTTKYKKSICTNFKKLKLKDKDINRILWGTDLDENAINDKPLAKFKFDLINEN